nr:hypothetical protein [Tanacetum cinerariifolium]
MDTTIDQQVARDKALVPHVKRLRIGRINFHLLSDIKSKESTLQLVYDVLRTRMTTYEKGKQAAKASKAKSLSALSEVAMTEAQQLKLATKRSLQQKHISQASGSGTDEGTGSIPGVLDVPTDESKEKISWNSTDEEGDDDEGKDGDGDDDDDQEVEGDDTMDDEEEGGDGEQDSDEEEFIHPSLSTQAEEEPRDEESFDHILKTPKILMMKEMVKRILA